MARSATRKKHGKKTHRGHGKKTRRSARRVLPPKIQRVRAMANLSALLRHNNDELANFGNNNNGNGHNENRNNANGRANPLARDLNANENAMNNLAESVGRMGRNNLPK